MPFSDTELNAESIKIGRLIGGRPVEINIDEWNKRLYEGIGYIERMHENPLDIAGAWFNPPYTTVKWVDGKTVTVKCADDDEYDREKGVLLCFAKRMYGGGRYNDMMRKALGGTE